MLNSGPVPKYHQLAELLRQQILDGILTSGDQLPTEETLSRSHQVSRGTVREALRLLIDEGLVRREQGRGTFVAAPETGSALFTLTSFDEEMRRQNRQPATRLLTAELFPAPPNIAERLRLPIGEPIIYIERLRLADHIPTIYETRYMAQNLCPTLLEENLISDSLHRLLVHKYKIPLVKMSHTVEIRAIAPPQAHKLQVPPGSAAFFVDRLTYTTRNGETRPAVWFQGIYREDSYNLYATLQRPSSGEPSL